MQYTAENFQNLDQMENFSDEEIFNMKVVSKILPFKTNNYVVEYLIDWNNVPNDPMFVLTFPQKNMLIKKHFDIIADLIKSDAKKQDLDNAANKIRLELNPHPAGQMELNIPTLKDGTKLYGLQHKYKETCLFFPSQSQTCHAYCSFCFRWPQFVGMDDMKFASKESGTLVQYLLEHPEITDVLFTGGDPMIMKGELFRKYVDDLLDANLPNLKTIRIGTKMLSYWPYKVLSDNDADVTLETFEEITKSGIHLSIMAHFNHYVEIQTQATRNAIKKIRATGAQIRTQSPLLAHINDDARVWKKMWTDPCLAWAWKDQVLILVNYKHLLSMVGLGCFSSSSVQWISNFVCGIVQTFLFCTSLYIRSAIISKCFFITYFFVEMSEQTWDRMERY